MELIYSMRRKPLKCEPPHFESTTDLEVIRPICTISSRNIIAFSSPTELSDADGESWGGHVYVCDMDTPWDSHKVTKTVHSVSALEWDSEGEYLLVATTVGDVSVFGMKDYLLNEWTCLYSANFPGEHIIKAVFFHNGRRVVALDKKPDAPITERIQILRYAPTLKGFGGVACEGACVITSTGLVGTLCPGAAGAGGAATVASEWLRPAREHVAAASFAQQSQGGLALAACAGGRVRCFALALAGGSLALRPLPALCVEATAVVWHPDGDALLVAGAGAGLSLWKLTERSHAVHKLLAKASADKPKPDSFNTLVWQQIGAWQGDGGGAVHIAACRLPQLSPLSPHAVLATPRSLHLIARDSHHYICSTTVTTSGISGVTGGAVVEGTPPKKAKYSLGSVPIGAPCAVVSCTDTSWLGGVVVAIDTHAQLHLYKIPHHAHDAASPLAVQQITNLLEFSMVSGYDCLDVLITTKPNIIESMYERLTESFQRQPYSFQQYYYHSWLKLRIALCRVSASAFVTLSALVSVQMVLACAAACAQALRPDDKPDDKSLWTLLDELPLPAAGADKALPPLDAGAEAVALQPLRRPLQRALDVAVAAMPLSAQRHEVWSSASVALRRVVAAARAAGRGGRAGEALARLLPRLAACTTPKPDLLEECAILSAQWPTPTVWEALPHTGVSAPHSRPHPFYLEYFVEPETLRCAPEPPGGAQPTPAMDNIRYMYLGGAGRPARWRQCSRCGARALPQAQPARHPVQRAYDARFLPACRCGALWRLCSNLQPQ